MPLPPRVALVRDHPPPSRRMTRPDAAEEAALNNAEWCDAVCRTHGNPGVFDAGAWTVPRRPPRMYPDAVTLRPGTGRELLRRIDDRAGASVKDSFAALDLAPDGFEVLFEAAWIRREPGAGAGAPRAVPVTTPDDLAAWATAHGGGGVFRPGLLRHPAVTVLAVMDADGAIAGGAAVNRSAAAAGVSNVFATTATLTEVWRAVIAYVPDVPLVGYESGADLDAATAVGFRSVGSLRVWLRQ